MNTRNQQLTECSACGMALPLNYNLPCPKCGASGRTHKETNLQVNITGKVSVIWGHTHTFYEKNIPIFVAVIVIAIGTPFLGLVLIGPYGVIVGLIFSLISLTLGPYAITKCREITRGESK